MSSSLAKRKRSDTESSLPPLSVEEKKILQVIRGREGEGIWSKDIKSKTNYGDAVINKWLKVLKNKQLIKEIASPQNKGKKFYVASEFNASEELTGGFWFSEGKFDEETVGNITKFCVYHLKKAKAGTIEDISNALNSSKVLKIECPTAKLGQLVKTLELKGTLVKTRSTGIGEFESIPIGADCYKLPSIRTTPKPAAALASIPCGVCPHVSICTPDGLVSPANCVYYDKWLEF